MRNLITLVYLVPLQTTMLDITLGEGKIDYV